MGAGFLLGKIPLFVGRKSGCNGIAHRLKLILKLGHFRIKAAA